MSHTALEAVRPRLEAPARIRPWLHAVGPNTVAACDRGQRDHAAKSRARRRSSGEQRAIAGERLEQGVDVLVDVVEVKRDP